MEKILTIDELSKKIKFSKAKIYQLLKNNQIPAIKIAGQYRFKQSVIDNWIEEESLKFLNNKPLQYDLDYFETIILELTKQSLNIWKEDDKRGTNESLNRINANIQNIESILPKISRDIDMVAIDLMHTYRKLFHKDEYEFRIRKVIGRLSSFFKEDPYNEDYTFYLWKEKDSLSVTILSPTLKPEKNLKRNDFVIHKNVIEDALKIKKEKSEEDAIAYISQNRIPNPNMDNYMVEKAAKIVLTSTKYTLDLMNQDRNKIDGMSFRDERNLIYIPYYALGEPIGGVVIFSHHKLPPIIAIVVRIIFEYLLYRIKVGDDMLLSSDFTIQQTRWNANYIFLQRLYHDIQKPLDRMESVIENYDRTKENIVDSNIIIEKLSEQFDYFKNVIRSSTGDSIEGLYKQAKSSSREISIPGLIDDAIWIYRDECNQNKKKIIENIDPNVKFAYLPKFLIIEILRNLFSNAVKFSKSEITVTANRLENNQNIICFQVENDGLQISTETINAIDKNIYLTDFSKLGLRISKFIIESILNGKLHVERTKNGTSASFCIGEIKNV